MSSSTLIPQLHLLVMAYTPYYFHGVLQLVRKLDSPIYYL